jgi:hypothetical protein
MSERPRKATPLTVSLEENDYRVLSEIALSRDASVSWVIRQAIRQFIDATPEPIGRMLRRRWAQSGGVSDEPHPPPRQIFCA